MDEENKNSTPVPAELPEEEQAAQEETGTEENLDLSKELAASLDESLKEEKVREEEAHLFDDISVQAWFRRLFRRSEKDDRKEEDEQNGTLQEEEVPSYTQEQTAGENESGRPEQTASAQRPKRRKRRHLHQPLSARSAAWMARGMIALMVIVLSVGILQLVRHWKYGRLKAEGSVTIDSAATEQYQNLSGSLLRIGSDKAVLYGKSRDTVWEAAYSMNHPDVSVSGDTAVIYDVGGTEIKIADKRSVLGGFRTEMPILKAVVSEQGNAAVIEGDGTTYRIRYYSKDGTLIASIGTAMNHPGFPMQISLTPDGTMLAAAYLSYADSTKKGQVYFYHFGDAGQNHQDNNVSRFEYENEIIPEIRFINGNTAVACGEHSLTFYKGASIPEQKKRITVEEEIASVFSNRKYVGIVTKSDADGGIFLLHIYNSDGKEVLKKSMDFMYETVEFSGDQISFYDHDTFRVWSIQGIEKYKGEIPESAQVFISTGMRRYVAADTSKLSWMRLK